MYLLIIDGNKQLRLNTADLGLSYNYKQITLSKEKENYFIKDKNTNKIVLLECKEYHFTFDDGFSELALYVYEDFDGYDDFQLFANQAFVYASHPKATIINNDQYFSKYYLIYREGHLETNGDNLLLNGKSYRDETLKENDMIEFNNFKMFYHDDFLYINNFKITNRLKCFLPQEQLVEYKKPPVKKINHYERYYNQLQFDKLDEFKSKPLTTQKKLILQIGPSLSMSLAMVLLAAINVYNNYLSGNSFLNSLVYIVMPVTMILSGVLWPIISNKSEKKNNEKINQELKEKYLAYLSEYEKDVDKRIKKYLEKENCYYFEGIKKLFYLTNKDEMFLKVSVGHIILNKELSIKLSEDVEIDQLLLAIKNKTANINNCPYFLDLKKYQVVSIVTEDINIIKHYLLELASKNHYEDFYLAIYSNKLNNYSEFYSLPELIYNNERLTLNKKSEVIELLSVKFNKPLILFSDVNVDFMIGNKDIHLLSFVKKRNDIPKNSELLIEYNKTGGLIYDKEIISFSYLPKEIDYKEELKKIAPYQKVNFLNKTINFKELFGEIKIKDFYEIKQVGLKADFAYLGNERLAFDLHESKAGPHGLIAGATGSGKSELIISMLLSLAIRYRPDYLNIILVDYKGGGIKESLSYNGQCIPHLVATIDNLEADVFERLIVVIDSECKRRQKLFKELSNKGLTSIMNLDDYLEADYQKYDLPKISHLLIVVDEFAEMKKENPEIIKELVSFSRIGRSLGIHLILATQRPNGIIDDEIWSNSHFKIALKVFNEKDSNDVVRHKDAAYLSNPGEFYLQVDESLVKAQSVYAKTDVNNGEPYEVSLLDNRLTVIKKKSIKKEQAFSEASYLVNEILKVCSQLAITTNKLEFKKPAQKTREQLIEEYSTRGGLIFGEVDDYLNAKKSLLEVAMDENIFIYSTRNKEINHILNTLKRPMVVVGSRRYKNNYIRDALKYEEQEDINYLFNKLLHEDYDLSLVIEDLAALLSFDENLISSIYQLLRRSTVKQLRLIILTKQSIVNYKLLNCFKEKLAIKINDSQDLINIFSCRSSTKGDTFYFKDGLLGFVPLLEEDFIEGSRQFKPLVKCVPDSLPYVKKEGIILLGFELVSRKEIVLYPNEKVLIASYDDSVIERYQELFSQDLNVEVCLYKRDLLKKEYTRIIWVGEGLYTQRLFYFDGKEELKENEALYYKNNKGTIIRFISYE